VSESCVSRSEWPGLIFHPLFTVLGCFLSIGCLLAVEGMLSFPHHRPYAVDSVLNPTLWIPSLLVGLIINRFVQHSWAFLAPAAIGALVISVIVYWDVSLFRKSAYEMNLAHGHVWRYEFERLFSPISAISSAKGDKVLAQLLVTFPFLSSVAYSTGAFLGCKFAVADTGREASTTENERN
jgi:hypothetical protein